MKSNEEISNIVVGMGPGGLAAAFALMLAGENVEIIDQRATFNRYQKIFVKRNLLEGFWGLTNLAQKGFRLAFDSSTAYDDGHFEIKGPIETLDAQDALDLAFFHKLQRNRSLISLNELQTYQLAKLKQIEKAQSLHYQHMVVSLPDTQHTVMANFEKLGRVKVSQGQYRVTDIDPDNCTITLSYRKSRVGFERKFKNLICADGASHSLITKLNTKRETPYVEYNDIAKPRHARFGTAEFNIPKGASIASEKPFAMSVETKAIGGRDMVFFKHMGWQEPYLPLYYLGIDKDSSSVYFAGEVPSCFTGENPQAALAQWVSYLVQREFNIKQDDISLRKRYGKPAQSMFDVDPKVASTRYIPLNGDASIVLVGDNVIPANLTFGHGVADAIRDANDIFQFFDFEAAQSLHKASMEKLKEAKESTMQQQRQEFSSIINSPDDKEAVDVLVGLSENLYVQVIAIRENHRPLEAYLRYPQVFYRNSLEERTNEFNKLQQNFDKNVYPLTHLNKQGYALHDLEKMTKRACTDGVLFNIEPKDMMRKLYEQYQTEIMEKETVASKTEGPSSTPEAPTYPGLKKKDFC